VRQRACGRLQITPGLLRQMNHAVGLIDDQARRREPLERLAMNRLLDRRAKSGRRPNWERLKTKRFRTGPREDPRLGRGGRSLINSRLAVDDAKHSDRTVGALGGAEKQIA